MLKSQAIKGALGAVLPAYVVASMYFLIVMPTLFGRCRNPPWHLYGALDLETQTRGFFLAAINLIISAVFVRLRPDRRVLIVALTTLWGGITFAFLTFYWKRLSFPPL